jgi:hypothetical protein
LCRTNSKGYLTHGALLRTKGHEAAQPVRLGPALMWPEGLTAAYRLPGTMTTMSTWGPGVFSNDLAADVRDQYRSLLEEQVPGDKASRRVIEAFSEVDEEESSDFCDFWLALAAAQHQVGRLDDQVKARALAIIDSAQALGRWEAETSAELARRKSVLAKLRAQLTGPQPSPKRLRKPRQEVTDLTAGDVLAYTAGNGATALFRVLRIEHSRHGDTPVLGWLDWQGQATPDSEHLQRLSVRVQDDADLAEYADDAPAIPRPLIASVNQATAKGPDWRTAGFVLTARVTPSADDATVETCFGMDWEHLAGDVERRFSRA